MALHYLHYLRLLLLRLPGFAFSERASTPGMDVIATAFVFDKLMIKLGYKYYIAQGGDW